MIQNLELNLIKRINAIDYFVIPLMTYSFGIIKRCVTGMQNMNRRIHKILNNVLNASSLERWKKSSNQQKLALRCSLIQVLCTYEQASVMNLSGKFKLFLDLQISNTNNQRHPNTDRLAIAYSNLQINRNEIQIVTNLSLMQNHQVKSKEGLKI